MNRVTSNSLEFPLFSNSRLQQSSDTSPKRTGLGKQCLPDCSTGNSNEFPSCFENQYTLKSRISIENPYTDEDFRGKSIMINKMANLQGGSGSVTTRNRYSEKRTIFEKDFRKENVLKNTDRILLRNLDKNTIDNPKIKTALIPQLQVDSQPARNDRIQLSVDLKANFTDFKLHENHSPDKSNFIKLPQLPIRQYDCIRDKEVEIKSPDLEIERYSKFRDKYFSILNSQNKPFNKKLGLFTLFADRTKPETVMNKIYDQLKTIDSNTYKAIKKLASEYNQSAKKEADQSMTSSNISKSIRGSNSVKILAGRKQNYRYFNNGQFIDKKDKTMDNDSVNQLNLSRRFTKISVFGDPNATITGGESAITDNKEDKEQSSLMVRTKSLGNIFSSGSLTSLRKSLKPSAVPSIDDEDRLQKQEFFKQLMERQRNLVALDQEIQEFEKTTLINEKIKYSGSPPLYSPARKSMEEKTKEQSQTRVTNFGFADSLNQRMTESDRFNKNEMFPNIHPIKEVPAEDRTEHDTSEIIFE